MSFLTLLVSREGPTPTTAFDDYPDVDSGSCRLLGPTALIVQGLMGILVILSLVYKRYREEPRRPWRIWLFDVSKQVVGQMFVHGVNVLISGVISELTDRNACVFYFLNILVDTTVGVGIIYGCLHLFNHIFTEKLGWKGFESGVYGDPPSVNFWFRQAATYMTCLLIMKLLVVGLFVLVPGIFTIGQWLLSWTHAGGEVLQVAFVMGIFPIVMNILQFWLIDSIVKASSTPSPVALEVDSADPFHTSDREPLFNVSDDEDEGDHRPRRLQRDIENQLSPPSQSTFAPDSYSTAATIMGEGAALKKYDADEEGRSVPGGQHSYPPSLSGSVGSSHSGPSTDGSKGPKRKVTLPADNNPKLEQSNKVTSSQNTHAPSNSEDWGASWDDDEDNWEDHGKGQAQKAQGQGHDRPTEDLWTSPPAPPMPKRNRRLS
ncbi:vacuolar membrane protein [Coprinopsis sp. MPI-PUGE-AT-0042]|nr:vacuolar membrane protein [Coprinopsis sp. MPI-PUGE-AT-0042]